MEAAPPSTVFDSGNALTTAFFDMGESLRKLTTSLDALRQERSELKDYIQNQTKLQLELHQECTWMRLEQTELIAGLKRQNKLLQDLHLGFAPDWILGFGSGLALAALLSRLMRYV